ncbi:MAG: hypothetical protein E7591_08805 [Ruminococcaceae bacterium]|nr:hypothetical protein [Oscillospiraceae bacterium]
MRTKKQELGQFFTNPIIADFMCDLVYHKSAQYVLDPAVGKGIFLTCLEKKGIHSIQGLAYDIDNEMINIANGIANKNIEFKNEDYLLSEIKNKPDIIVCNPPYNKFQEIPDRNKYIELFKEKYNFVISGYSNLCIYFLMKSLFELNENGKCAYIIPFEFFNTGYGERIKEFFIQSKFLKEIYIFDSKLSLFDDALTTSCILLFEKKEHKKVKFVLINNIEEIKNKQFKKSKNYYYNELNCKEKWSKYFSYNEKKSYNNLIEFSQIAKVKRGIATGGNAFFTLSKEQIENIGLSANTLVKCICKSPDIKKPIFQESDFQKLYLSNKKVYIFNGKNATNEYDFGYINYGETHNFDKSFLTSHRSPWYSLENKDVAPIWISVFNRSSLKVVRNETESKNLTTFHGVYLNDEFNNDKTANILFCYLLTPVSQCILKTNKREYGGGLEKFEPNDLNNARILNINVISNDDSVKILSLYEKLKKNEQEYTEVVEALNDIFCLYLM